MCRLAATMNDSTAAARRKTIDPHTNLPVLRTYLGRGGPDPLVLDQGGDHVAQHRPAVRRGAPQLAVAAHAYDATC